MLEETFVTVQRTKFGRTLTDFEYLDRQDGGDVPEVDVPGSRADVVCGRQQNDD